MTLSDAIDRVKERFPKWTYSRGVNDQVLDLRALGVVILAAELHNTQIVAFERSEQRAADRAKEA